MSAALRCVALRSKGREGGLTVDIHQHVKQERKGPELCLKVEARPVRHCEGDVKQQEQLADVPEPAEVAVRISHSRWQGCGFEERRRLAIKHVNITPLLLHGYHQLEPRSQIRPEGFS